MIDLHMHSTCSDGTESVEELIDSVINANIDYFALTDHDTAEGCRKILASEELKQKIHNAKTNFVCGIEFSCIYKGRKVHILAYDIDPNSDVILELEQKLKDLMKEKDFYRYKAIEEAGFKLSKESIDFLNSRVNRRDPDFANCLINDGYFDSLKVAIESFLKKIPYPRKYLYDAVEVIEKLSKSGAKVVWAHPIYGVNQIPLTFENIEDFARDFKGFGMVGLECYYVLYNKDEIESLRNIAKKLDLYITCGSDYHGKNKDVKITTRSSDGTPVLENEIKIIETFENVVN